MPRTRTNDNEIILMMFTVYPCKNSILSGNL